MKKARLEYYRKQVEETRYILEGVLAIFEARSEYGARDPHSPLHAKLLKVHVEKLRELYNDLYRDEETADA